MLNQSKNTKKINVSDKSCNFTPKQNHMFRRLATTALSLMLFAATAAAQFYVTGDDPARVRWNQVETENFRLIYPRGLDSLARVYGRELERWRTPVGQSIHYLPGEYTRGKMPVVLHPYNSDSNGSVAWAPHRVDLYTQPDAYPFMPLSWDRMLVIHESRHVAQMQFGLTKTLRPFGWFFGEMIAGGASGLYGHPSWMEGDAVIAETALTNSGRGRTADFLNYYRISFDQGQMRNFSRWSHESQTRFIPDKYAFGYLTLSGFRYFYDAKDFVGDNYEHFARMPLDVTNFHVIRKLTGKFLRDAFAEVADSMAVRWRAELDERAPFMPMEQVTKTDRGFTQYSGLASLDGDIYAIRKSLYRSPRLVRIDSTGKTRSIRSFSAKSGGLRSDGESLWWSETVDGPRWDMENRSSLRRISSVRKNASDGSHARLRHPVSVTRKGRYFNPSPNSDGSKVLAAEYFDLGGTGISTIDVKTKERRSVRMPDSLQVTETAWLGDKRIFAIAISDSGSGLYEIVNPETGATSWKTIIEPQPVIMADLGSRNGELIFTSDRTGEHELYSVDPDSGRVNQITNIRYGAKWFRYSDDGEWLYYAAPQLEGTPVFRTAVDSLPVKTVDFSQRYSYFIADRLSEQEKEYGVSPLDEDSVSFSEVRRWRKLPHLFNVHSWAPLYVNVDNIMNQSFDRIYQVAAPGATVLMQNRLSTMVTQIGYAAHKDPANKDRWRHSGHVKMTYTGWYPVFEASLDFNDRAANDYLPTRAYRYADGKTGFSTPSAASGRPALEAQISAYIPWRWYKGGWVSGIIPKASYTVSNDHYDTSLAIWDSREESLGLRFFDSYVPGKIMARQTINASVRGYIMNATAKNAVYPRFGIGAEVGALSRLGLGLPAPASRALFKPTLYGYGYMYLPGFLPEQGWKLTAKYQRSLVSKGIYWGGGLNMLPRGMSGNAELLQAASSAQKQVINLTAEYGIPFSVGDLDLLHGLLFVKSMTLTPHFDLMLNADGNLFSAGATLTADLSGIIWALVPISVGVSWSYNGGSAYSGYEASGIEIGHNFFGPVFRVSLP